MIEITGQKELKEFFKRKQNQIEEETNKSVNKAALLLQTEIKLSIAGQKAEPTSVDTGRFLNSIDVDARGNEALVFTSLDYPIHLEYGTSKIKPRPHFRNSLKRNEEEVNKIFLDGVKKAVN